MEYGDEELQDSMECPEGMKDAPEVPKITKALPIIKWTEAFQDYLNRCIGIHTIPLSYVI